MSPPIISLASEQVVSEIEKACSTCGAFVLVDHFLEPSFLQKVLDTGHAFFQLPQSTKEKYHLQLHGAKWRGYMPVGGERSVKGKFLDHKEGLYMGDEFSVDDPHLGLPAFGTNVFPDAEIPEMRPVFLEYHQKMKELGNRIMKLLSKALHLPDDYIETHITKHDPVILPRMFWYLPQSQSDNDVEDSEEAVHWGIGRHSDYGLWTMILTDAPGLEFQDSESGEWNEVPFVPYSIVMNVGDVLDRLSNGRFVSAYHRARNLSCSNPRLRLPFFYDPAWTARMKTLPEGGTPTEEARKRWSMTKITCEFDGSVEYSKFLAKKVAKVFPELVPENFWKNISSTSEPSARHALVVSSPDVVVAERVLNRTKRFYKNRPEIKPSHGWNDHVSIVYNHAAKAIACHQPPLSATQALQVKVASLLHDVDDQKYFPENSDYENARAIMKDSDVPTEIQDGILEMIRLVSCSANGNHVPQTIIDSGDYYKLITRWSDRLEAVGAMGVVRCYQYSQENGRPLSSPQSPRAQTAADVWEYATQDRFDAYQARGGSSADMISHYYDKLLHVACPPRELVRNTYLERMAEESATELVEVCIRFGKTGIVDEDYIQQVTRMLSFSKK